MPTKVSKIPEDFKLEIKLVESGLLIIGNKCGLTKLSKLIQQIAESKEFDHRHLLFDFNNEVDKGSFLLDLNYGVQLQDNSDNQPDVTVLKSEKIGPDLWNSN